MVRPRSPRPPVLERTVLDFAVHLLQEEIEPLAHFAAAGEHGVELRGVRPQADQLLGDVAAVGQQGGFLRQALRVHAGAVAASRPVFRADACGRRRRRPRESLPCGPPGRRTFWQRCRISCADGGAFPLAEGVEQDQRFGGGFQNGLGDRLFNLFVAGGAQHARNAQGGVEVRLAAQPVDPGGVAKGLHVGVEQRPVQRGGGARRPGEGNLDLHVAARHPALDDAADVVLQSVHFRGHAAVHVQAAMVHALQGGDNLALLDVSSHAGEARHAAQAHKSTTDPASSN